MGTSGKINAVWWNIKINLQKSVDTSMCGYELPANLQNLKQKDFAEVKIFWKVFFLGGATFLWNTLQTLETWSAGVVWESVPAWLCSAFIKHQWWVTIHGLLLKIMFPGQTAVHRRAYSVSRCVLMQIYTDVGSLMAMVRLLWDWNGACSSL